MILEEGVQPVRATACEQGHKMLQESIRRTEIFIHKRRAFLPASILFDSFSSRVRRIRYNSFSSSTTNPPPCSASATASCELACFGPNTNGERECSRFQNVVHALTETSPDVCDMSIFIERHENADAVDQDYFLTGVLVHFGKSDEGCVSFKPVFRPAPDVRPSVHGVQGSSTSRASFSES